MRTNGRTERHDEAIIRFLQFCECTLKCVCILTHWFIFLLREPPLFLGGGCGGGYIKCDIIFPLHSKLKFVIHYELHSFMVNVRGL